MKFRPRGGHRNEMLENVIGKKCKVTFKDKNCCIGVVDHGEWKYCMIGYEWIDKRGTDYNFHSDGKLSFAHSNVRKVEVCET